MNRHESFKDELHFPACRGEVDRSKIIMDMTGPIERVFVDGRAVIYKPEPKQYYATLNKIDPRRWSVKMDLGEKHSIVFSSNNREAVLRQALQYINSAHSLVGIPQITMDQILFTLGA